MSTGNHISEKYKTLAVSSPEEFLYTVQLNRPQKLNALSDVMWQYVYMLNSYLYYDQNLILFI